MVLDAENELQGSGAARRLLKSRIFSFFALVSVGEPTDTPRAFLIPVVAAPHSSFRRGLASGWLDIVSGWW